VVLDKTGKLIELTIDKTDTKTISADDALKLINFYTAKNVKFMLNYSIINHDRYASGKGKIFVGRDITGELTKDPKKVANATGNGGEDYSQLGVRCEIAF
jgi:phosphate-selective porin OprO/OprP